MSYPVPNSDDPILAEGLEGKEPKTLRGWNLLIYRCKQQPLVPLGNLPIAVNDIPDLKKFVNIVGALATIAALAGAARMGYRKNSKGMQYFFRARVAAQAFTVLALWAGIYVYEDDRRSNNWKARERSEAAAKAKHVKQRTLRIINCRMPGWRLLMLRMKLIWQLRIQV